MSFDSEFDYSSVSTFISNRSDVINGEISTIDGELATIANISSTYDYLTTDKSNSLTHTKNVYNTMLSN